jgi:hypothetical protein
MAGLGAALLHWWEPRAAAVTLNGSNISASAKLVGGGPALSQGTAGNQPAWVNDGSGPGGRPVVHLHDSVRRMTAALTELAAGHRTGVYAVVSHSTADADRFATTLHHTAPTTAHHFYSRNAASPQGLKMFADFTTGTDFNATVNDFVAGYVLRSFRPLATGARGEINGTLAAVQPSNTNGLLAADRFTLGHPAATGADVRIAAVILTTEPVTAVDTAVKAYVAARFGLTLA